VGPKPAAPFPHWWPVIPPNNMRASMMKPTEYAKKPEKVDMTSRHGIA
jgi:hypothetical protein